MITPPAGAVGRGDGFILRIAEKSGALVLSNDSFQEFHAERPWLFEPGRLIGGKPVPGVGWIFTPRTPVRGARSRSVTAKSKREGQPPTDRTLSRTDPERSAGRTESAGDGAFRLEGLQWPRRTDRARDQAGQATKATKVQGGQDDRQGRQGHQGCRQEGRQGQRPPKRPRRPRPTKAPRSTKATKASKTTKATKAAKAAKAAKVARRRRTAANQGRQAGQEDRPTRPPRRQKVTTASGRPNRRNGSWRSRTAGHSRPSTTDDLPHLRGRPSGRQYLRRHGGLVHLPRRPCRRRRDALPRTAAWPGPIQPPNKARQVLAKGETRSFVLVSLDAARRRAELALPGLRTVAKFVRAFGPNSPAPETRRPAR